MTLANAHRPWLALIILFMNDIDPLPESNRREFLKNASLATMMTLMGGVELRAQDATKAAPGGGTALTVIPPPPTVNFGVIGLNEWGKEILHQLSLMEAKGVHYAPVVAICDNYSHALRKAGQEAPNAKPYEKYRIFWPTRMSRPS